MPNQSVVIKGGRIIDSSGDRTGDVLIMNGSISAVGPDLGGDIVLDASGCVVSPGFVDLHASMGEPGFEQNETIETAARAAALGGFTAVVAKPDTAPCTDSASVVRDILAIASGVSCEILVSGAITVGREGNLLAPMAEMANLGVRLFTDAPNGVADDRLMRRAMEYASVLGIRLAQHCEVPELSNGSAMNEGEWSSRLGVPGQPAEAEDLMLMRDLALVRLSGCPTHFLHLSSRGALAMVEAAKSAGMPVTADVTPHHLTFTEAELATYDTAFKLSPPLRTESDRQALIAGLADGAIDAVSSDHSPCSDESKDEPFDMAAIGSIGLETALAVMITRSGLELSEIVSVMSTNPANIAGVQDRHGRVIEDGAPANICVFDPQTEWQIDRDIGASMSRNDIFDGLTVRGKVRHTINAGEPVVVDGEPQR